MGSINLKHTGSGSAITLSSDGTNLLLDGTAIGGGGGGSPDLYAENYDGTSTLPTATGTNAVALGDGSNATGYKSFAAAIGNTYSSYGANGFGSVSIGLQSRANGTSSVAIGQNAKSEGTSSYAFGGYANYTYSTSLGYKARAEAIDATAIGNSLASGTDSFAAAITNNTTSYGATGANSIAIGTLAKAAGSYSVALGNQALTSAGYSGAVALGASYAKGNNSFAAALGGSSTQYGALGNNSMAMGYQSTTSSANSVAFGYRSKATGSDATVFGIEGQSAIACKTAFGGRKFTSSGDCQGAKYILKAETTDATPKEMVSGFASSSVYENRVLALENNSAYAFHGTIVARQKASEGTASAAWKIEGLIRREGSEATTVLVNSSITALDNTPSWGLSLSANTATYAGNLAITVTGASSTNIRWVSNIDTSELTYA